MLADLPRLSIKNRYLLPLRMKITTYNLHEGFSLLQQFWSQIKTTVLVEAFDLSHQFMTGFIVMSGMRIPEAAEVIRSRS
jgi:hypothetical protein